MPSSVDQKPIVAFVCNWSPYRSLLALSASGRLARPELRPIKIPCSGRIDPAMILTAFEQGAAGVAVIDCGQGECRYVDGPDKANQALGATEKIIDLLGLKPDRLVRLSVADGDHNGLLDQLNRLFAAAAAWDDSPWAGGRR